MGKGNLHAVPQTGSSLSRPPTENERLAGTDAEAAPHSDSARHGAPSHRHSHRRGPAGGAGARTADVLVGAVLAGYALLLYLPYALRSSFLLDDYTMIEHFRFGTWLPTYRPTFRLEMDGTHALFGDSPRGYYVLLAVMAAAIGVLLFATLRSLGLSLVPAAMAGTLVVAYPKADSVLLWWSSSSALALCLGLASVWMGSVWLRRTGWSPGLLVPAMALMAASVLCYESIFPLFLLLVCLVPLSPRPRRLLAVAAMEGATACGAALYMFATEAKARNALPVGAYATRAAQLVTGGLRTYPLGGLGMPTTVGLCFGVGVVVAVAIVVAVCGPACLTRGLEPPWRLLLTVPLLAVGAVVSLVPFLPAPSYYVPEGVGVANRVNALPQVFVVSAIAAAVWFVARVVGGWRRPVAAAVIAGAVAVAVVGAFAGAVRSDQSGYLAAARYRASMIDEVHRLLPAPPTKGGIVFLGGYVQNEGTPADPAYPTIQNAWDASATMQLLYGTVDFSGWTVSPSTECRPTTIFSSLLGADVDVPYRDATIVDIGAHRVLRFSDQQECLAALPRLAEPR